MNKQVLKTELSLHCRVCLCIDRNLAPIGQYADILCTIMINTEISMDISSFKICWECRGTLHKTLGLRKRVLQAQQLLQLAQLCSTIDPPKSLSNLKVSYKQNYDYEFAHSDEKIEIEVKDVKCESPVDLYEDTNIDVSFEELPREDVKFEDPEGVKFENVQGDVKMEIADCDMQDAALDDKKTIPQLLNWMKSRHKGSRASPKINYKVIEVARNVSMKSLHMPILMAHDEMMSHLEKERNDPYFLDLPYKCMSCIVGYKSKNLLMKHNQKFHTRASGRLRCDICLAHNSSKQAMAAHCRKHYTKYKCLLCAHECYKNVNMYYHMRTRHVNVKIHECLKCGAQSSSRREFYNHYREVHKTFICDYCRRLFDSKRKLSRHIRRKHDTPTCHECNMTFKAWRNQKSHMQLKHMTEMTEESFCVECNLQFDNIHQFKRHLRTAVRHKRKVVRSFTCPVCSKVYARKHALNNHYNYAHLNQSKHYCDKCDRYFLNSFRIRQHKKSTHDKIPPLKNKMCNICGRGFSTNRILTNHVRTHTGERPHECEHCPAKFAQLTALKTHVKAIHMKHKQVL